MTTTKYTAVSRVLSRLDDLTGRTEETAVYSRGEIGIYVQDGYDRLCRRTKCLYDVTYIENRPAMGCYSSEEEFELAKQIPGLLLTGKRNFTREVDREFAPAGSVGPAGVSTPEEAALLPSTVETANPTGKLPRGVVEVERVVHNQITIYPEFTRGLARERDSRYETQGGTPYFFTIDQDGIFTLRRYPTGDGAASYSEATAWFGGETYDPDYTGDIIGDWGILTYDPEEFPAGGPWGGPTLKHPDANNTRVEFIRLGRSLDIYPFEVPDHYVKYVEFWACFRALSREGPGQDLELADHYKGRFETGVSRLRNRVRFTEDEYTGRIGHGRERVAVAPLRIHLPYNYGTLKRRRSY